MTATTFNALAAARTLEAAGIERRQAEAIAEGMREAARHSMALRRPRGSKQLDGWLTGLCPSRDRARAPASRLLPSRLRGGGRTGRWWSGWRGRRVAAPSRGRHRHHRTGEPGNAAGYPGHRALPADRRDVGRRSRRDATVHSRIGGKRMTGLDPIRWTNQGCRRRCSRLCIT